MSENALKNIVEKVLPKHRPSNVPEFLSDVKRVLYKFSADYQGIVFRQGCGIPCALLYGEGSGLDSKSTNNQISEYLGQYGQFKIKGYRKKRVFIPQDDQTAIETYHAFTKTDTTSNVFDYVFPIAEKIVLDTAMKNTDVEKILGGHYVIVRTDSEIKLRCADLSEANHAYLERIFHDVNPFEGIIKETASQFDAVLSKHTVTEEDRLTGITNFRKLVEETGIVSHLVDTEACNDIINGGYLFYRDLLDPEHEDKGLSHEDAFQKAKDAILLLANHYQFGQETTDDSEDQTEPVETVEDQTEPAETPGGQSGLELIEVNLIEEEDEEGEINE